MTLYPDAHCSFYPGATREKEVKIPDGKGNFLILSEGMTTKKGLCPYRELIPNIGYQCMCHSWDRIKIGCEV